MKCKYIHYLELIEDMRCCINAIVSPGGLSEGVCTLLVSLPNNVGKGTGADSLRKANIVPRTSDLGGTKADDTVRRYYRIFEMEALCVTLCDF